MLELIPAAVELAGRQAEEHERVIRIGRMAESQEHGDDYSAGASRVMPCVLFENATGRDLRTCGARNDIAATIGADTPCSKLSPIDVISFPSAPRGCRSRSPMCL